MKTYLNWSTNKPTFEEVEGKQVLVKYNNTIVEYISLIYVEDKFRFSTYIDENKSFDSYTILTEEKCKWIPVDNDFTRASCCNEKLIIDGEYCPRCGARIEIVKELETFPYKEKLPQIGISRTGSKNWYAEYSEQEKDNPGDDSLRFIFYGASKEIVIKKWNDFVEGK